MSARKPPAVTLQTPIGPDVDLENEEVYLPDGTRLTEAVAQEITEEVLHKAGRPALAGHAGRSPQITFRTPRSLRDAAARRAHHEGKTLSQLAREALESYLNRSA